VAALTDWDRYYRLIRDSNNVAARNVHVVGDIPPDGADPDHLVGLSCLVSGAFDQAREMTLDVSARLPQGSRLLFEAPLDMLDELGLRREQVHVDEPASTGRLPVTPHGRQLVGTARLPAGSARECRLLVGLPELLEDRSARLALRQSYRGVEVGRVTWLLAEQRRRAARHSRI